jgi:hypothetical protein
MGKMLTQRLPFQKYLWKEGPSVAFFFSECLLIPGFPLCHDHRGSSDPLIEPNQELVPNQELADSAQQELAEPSAKKNV